MYSKIYCTLKVKNSVFFFGICAEMVFLCKIRKNDQKMQKNQFFISIFSKVPQMFLKGLWGVLGVPRGSKRAIFAYLGAWKLSRFRFKSIISVLILENFKQEIRVTLPAKRCFRLGHFKLTSLSNLLNWYSKITISLLWCKSYHFLHGIWCKMHCKPIMTIKVHYVKQDDGIDDSGDQLVKWYQFWVNVK